MLDLFLISTILTVLLLWGLQMLPCLLKYTFILAALVVIWVIYAYVGHIGSIDYPFSKLTKNVPAKAQLRQKQKELISYLQINPESCEGWILLAKSYHSLGQLTEGRYIDSYVKEVCGDKEQS